MEGCPTREIRHLQNCSSVLSSTASKRVCTNKITRYCRHDGAFQGRTGRYSAQGETRPFMQKGIMDSGWRMRARDELMQGLKLEVDRRGAAGCGIARSRRRGYKKGARPSEERDSWAISEARFDSYGSRWKGCGSPGRTCAQKIRLITHCSVRASM